MDIGTWRVIESKILGESRKLMVSLPPGHDAGEDRVPVLCLLDARRNFTHTVGLVRFQQSQDNLPPLIVVGIANTSRARDMTPPVREADSRFLENGGVEDFLRCLREEVFPRAERDDRGSSHRTLVGHSFGGLTALHALVHHPEDYAAYLAISPSLWWDEQRLVEQATTAFAGAPERTQRLFMTLGSEDGRMRGGFLKFQALLTESAPAGLAWRARLLEEETHTSVVYRSSLYGLRFLYQPWSADELAGDYLRGGWAAVHARLATAATRYGTPRSFSTSTLVDLGEQLSAGGRLPAGRRSRAGGGRARRRASRLHRRAPAGSGLGGCAQGAA